MGALYPLCVSQALCKRHRVGIPQHHLRVSLDLVRVPQHHGDGEVGGSGWGGHRTLKESLRHLGGLPRAVHGHPLALDEESKILCEHPTEPYGGPKSHWGSHSPLGAFQALGGSPIAPCGISIAPGEGLQALSGGSKEWGGPIALDGGPDTGLTRGLGVPAVASQEPTAEAAAATEVLRNTDRFPGAAEPWHISVLLPAGQGLPSGSHPSCAREPHRSPPQSLTHVVPWSPGWRDAGR